MSQQAVTRNRWSLTVSDNRWLFAAFLLTLAVSAALLFLPLAERTGVGTSMEAGQPAGTVETTDRESLLEAAGWGAAAALLLIPVAVAAAALVTPRRARRPVAIASASVLGISVILGAASVGLFYLPSAILLVIGATRQRD
ncbi:hypothetical protein [Salinispora sp. H7-4]|uniref:hypothetical protein n=1 Tax=Salinispora sp. H7-4 TaxID=2748321 RepID=UPI0015D286DE|nr:hypothetical protein [Salinispora sp. H7-4]NYT95676.1 hypothetical protein [Salinispora sp. H7-4]